MESLLELRSLGEFVPKNLRNIDFELEFEVDFKESLGCFLKGYISNGGSLESLDFWIKRCGYKIVFEQSGIKIIERRTTDDYYIEYYW